MLVLEGLEGLLKTRGFAEGPVNFVSYSKESPP